MDLQGECDGFCPTIVGTCRISVQQCYLETDSVFCVSSLMNCFFIFFSLSFSDCDFAILIHLFKKKNRPVIRKLWVTGRASDDSDEWTEEVRAHCERCYDDKEETSEVQAETILSQRKREDLYVALQDFSS